MFLLQETASLELKKCLTDWCVNYVTPTAYFYNWFGKCRTIGSCIELLEQRTKLPHVEVLTIVSQAINYSKK